MESADQIYRETKDDWARRTAIELAIRAQDKVGNATVPNGQVATVVLATAKDFYPALMRDRFV